MVDTKLTEVVGGNTFLTSGGVYYFRVFDSADYYVDLDIGVLQRKSFPAGCLVKVVKPYLAPKTCRDGFDPVRAPLLENYPIGSFVCRLNLYGVILDGGLFATKNDVSKVRDHWRGVPAYYQPVSDMVVGFDGNHIPYYRLKN